MTGFDEMLVHFGCCLLFWTVLFYALVFAPHCLQSFFPPSSKDHENSVYYLARELSGLIHTSFIAVVSLPVMIYFVAAPEEERFRAPEHLGFCRSEIPEGSGAWVEFADLAIYFAGMMFTTFMIIDVLLLVVHKQYHDGILGLIHHVVFACVGLVIRGHCVLPFNASILLSMEASTPFLSVMLLWRNRGGSYSKRVDLAGSTFAVLFVIFRLVFNTYGTYVLLSKGGDAMPSDRVPRWQAYFVLTGVVAGSIMQFAWSPAVIKIFLRSVARLRGVGNEREIITSEVVQLSNPDL